MAKKAEGEEEGGEGQGEEQGEDQEARRARAPQEGQGQACGAEETGAQGESQGKKRRSAAPPKPHCRRARLVLCRARWRPVLR